MINLEKLSEQLNAFVPKLDKAKDRGKLNQFEAFKKQVTVKIGMYNDLEKKQGKCLNDINEYLEHLSKFGFNYEGEAEKPQAPRMPRRVAAPAPQEEEAVE